MELSSVVQVMWLQTTFEKETAQLIFAESSISGSPASEPMTPDDIM